MKWETLDITPEMAGKMLKRNKDNRPLSQSLVARYAGAMLRGEWEHTHEGIAFNGSGDLIDGQSRLYAIIKSGCTVKLECATGLDAKSPLSSPINTGKHRSISDSTGVEKMRAETCSFVSVFTCNPRYLTVAQVEPFIVFWLPYADELLTGQSTRVRYRSAVPIRSAAMVCMALHPDRPTRQQYGALIRLDYGKMADSVVTLNRAIERGTVDPRDSSRVFVCSYMAFSRDAVKQFSTKDLSIPAGKIRAEIKKIMGLEEK